MILTKMLEYKKEKGIDTVLTVVQALSASDRSPS